jgi:hypothetical protein
MWNRSADVATLKIAIQVVWTISVVGAATFFSAPYGWQQHGFVGALALGSVGFALSAVRRKPGLGAAIVALSTRYVDG